MRRTPALIVGAGPAGAAAAIRLAQAGAPHLLVERRGTVDDALCGGFLSWRSLDTLDALGIDRDTLGGHRIARTRLFAGERTAEARLPRLAMAVSRHRLDTLLMHRAVAAGATVERGVGIRAIDGRTARTQDGAEIAADALFLASGKHDVRGLARPGEARGTDPTLGLRVRIGAHPMLQRLIGDAVELHLTLGGYVGIALQEDGSANVCMAVHRSMLHAAGSPAALLSRLARASAPLGERLAFVHANAAIDAIANIPYGWRETEAHAGLFRLGDQAGVIPSLAGEGMGIALASGLRAAAAYVRGGAAESTAWQRRFARTLVRPIGVAGMVRTLVESRAAPTLLPLARAPVIRAVARATRV